MFELLVALFFSASAPSEAHQRGLELYKQKSYAAALGVLQEAVKTENVGSPEYKESVLLIGQSYFMLSQAPKAIPWLEKAPDVNEANYMLGYAYLQNKEPEKSEAAFSRLFGLKAESASGHLLSGQMMLKKEYEEEAVSEVRKALELNPDLPEAHYLLAEVAIFRGYLDDAISELKKELAIDPNFSMAWYRLGHAYAKQEHWDLAIPHLQRAIWLNPDFSGPYILLGKCYMKQDNLMNAEGILRAALKIDPQNREAIYLLGQTLVMAGRKEEGQKLLDKLRPAP